MGNLYNLSSVTVSVSRSTHIFLQSAASQSKKTVTTVTLSIVQRRKDSLQMACHGSDDQRVVSVFSSAQMKTVEPYLTMIGHAQLPQQTPYTLPCKLLLHQCDASRVVTPLPAAARQWRHQRQAPVSTVQISECCVLHDRLPKRPHPVPTCQDIMCFDVFLYTSPGLLLYLVSTSRESETLWPHDLLPIWHVGLLQCNWPSPHVESHQTWRFEAGHRPSENDFVQNPHEKRTNSQ